MRLVHHFEVRLIYSSCAVQHFLYFEVDSENIVYTNCADGCGVYNCILGFITGMCCNRVIEHYHSHKSYPTA
jgi:hypothetical protein